MTRFPDFKMNGLEYFVAVMESPWAVRCFAEPYAQFLQVRRGGCWIDCPAFRPHPFYVAEGGIMVTVGGGTQQWRSALDVPVTDSLPNFPLVPLGNFRRDPRDVQKTEILIGRSPRGGNRLIPAFPRAFYLSPFEREPQQRMSTMLQIIEDELHGGTDLVESDGVISRAAEIMTIALARYVKAQLADNPNWPEVATDEQLMRALRLIETHPARNWTVDSLAAEIGMGRSAFALRFRSLLGDTPMNYLLRTRMQLAASAVRDGRRSMSAVANSVGYVSEPAFIKAFRRYFGKTPGNYRAAILGRDRHDSPDPTSSPAHFTAPSP